MKQIVTTILVFVTTTFYTQEEYVNPDTISPKVITHSFDFMTFPTLEIGGQYLYHFDQLNLRVAMVGELFPEEERTYPLELPVALTDTSIIYRGTDIDQSSFDFRIGVEKEWQILKQESINANRKGFFSCGIDLSVGSYTRTSSYGEGYVRYFRDSISGQMSYLDYHGNIVTDPNRAYGVNTLYAESKWKYRKWGIYPNCTIRLRSNKLPFTCGVQFSKRYQFYHLLEEEIDDPLSLIDVREPSYFEKGAMIYLLFGITI